MLSSAPIGRFMVSMSGAVGSKIVLSITEMLGGGIGGGHCKRLEQTRALNIVGNVRDGSQLSSSMSCTAGSAQLSIQLPRRRNT